MTKKRLFPLFFFIILLILFVYCKRAEPNLEKIVVRLKWLHQAQFAGFYVAEQKGFYKEAGLDVKLNPGGVDFPAVQMVSGGSEQFGVTAADQLILARAKGVPVVALCVIYRVSPFVLFSLKESNIKEPKDFIGKKIGVKLGGNEELTYRALMRKSGISFDQVKEIPVKYDLSSLFSKRIDVWPGYSINEPIVAKEKGYEVNIIWPKDYGVNLYADAVFTTDKFLKNNENIVYNFLKATLKGWQFSIENPDEAVKYTLIYSDSLNYGHEKSMMLESIRLIKPDDKPIGWMDREIWANMKNLLIEENFLKDSVDIDKVFNSRMIEKVYKEVF